MLNISLPHMHYDIGAAPPSVEVAAAQMGNAVRKSFGRSRDARSQQRLLKLSHCLGAGGPLLI